MLLPLRVVALELLPVSVVLKVSISDAAGAVDDDDDDDDDDKDDEDLRIEDSIACQNFEVLNNIANEHSDSHDMNRFRVFTAVHASLQRPR
jgi:hypothetical protein